jgi:hypothetical protein
MVVPIKNRLLYLTRLTMRMARAMGGYCARRNDIMPYGASLKGESQSLADKSNFCALQPKPLLGRGKVTAT